MTQAGPPSLELRLEPIDGDAPAVVARREWEEGGVTCMIGTHTLADLRLPKELYATIGQRVVRVLWRADGVRAEAVLGPMAPVLLDGNKLPPEPQRVEPGEHELVLGDRIRFRFTVRIEGEMVERPSAGQEPLPQAPNRIASRQTPYNDRYPTCDRTCAELRIYPEAIDPRQITERLGVKPTDMAVKGIEERTPGGMVRPARLSRWILSSEAEVDSKDLRRHLDWLLRRLLPTKDPLAALQLTPGTIMSVTCIWWSAHGHGGPALWPEQMVALADLGLECSFDIQFYATDEEEK